MSGAAAASDLFGGRVALVNAAAGSGIGGAIVRAFLARGACVMATDKSASRVERLRLSLVAEYGEARVATRTVDAADEAAVAASVAATVEAFGALDMLVNSVGFNSLSRIVDTTREAWSGVLDASLTSHFLHLKHAWPHLLASDHATVVNISSLANERPTAMGEAAYAAAKAGVLGLTRAAAAEGAPRIRVNAVVPGLIWNDNLARAVDEDYIERYRASSPLGRAGTPEEVAEVVMFLCSPASAHVSGSEIRVAC
ncbi:MAG: SDR family oxidoreductase [Gammaproteobacteria bacterium]|nr:SDR family oxidoreductase [Gammaproteobacteria bacterium]